MPDQTLDPQIVNLAKAIRQTESGGNFQAQGKSGEYGAYQFMAPTWAADSKAILGTDVPANKATPEQQNEVAYKTLAAAKAAHPDWNVGQFASWWNSGSPDNYDNGHAGTNSEGVQYDTPAYAKKVAEAYQQIKGQGNSSSGYNPTPFSSGDVGLDKTVTSTTPAAPSFLQEAGSDINNAGAGVAKAVSDTSSGKINPVSGIIQGLGAVAGGANSLINTSLTHLPVVGGVIKGGEDLLGEGVSKLAQTAPGQAVAKGVSDFSTAHPELSADIGGAANIAGLVGSFYGGGAAVGAAKDAVGGAIAKGALGSTLKDVAENAATKEALEIVAPKQTAGVARSAIKSGRTTTKGILGKVVAEPDQQTLDAAAAVKPLVQNGTLKSGMDVSTKANAVQDEIGNEADNLRSQLHTLEVKPIIQPEDLQNLKTGIDQQLSESPLMVGNAETSGQRIIQKFYSLLPTGRDITAEDILDARQGLDRWARSQKPKIFDANAENAQSTALDIVRRGANNLIAEKAPTVGVKTSLARQSALYRALDNIANTGYKEIGSNKITRFAKRHPLTTGLIKTGAKYAGMGIGIKGGEDLLP